MERERLIKKAVLICCIFILAAGVLMSITNFVLLPKARATLTRSIWIDMSEILIQPSFYFCIGFLLSILILKHVRISKSYKVLLWSGIVVTVFCLGTVLMTYFQIVEISQLLRLSVLLVEFPFIFLAFGFVSGVGVLAKCEVV